MRREDRGRGTDGLQYDAGRFAARVRFLVRRLLRVRLFTKILLANAVIIATAMLATAAAMGGLITLPMDEAAVARIGLLIAAGGVATVAISGFVVRLALEPLRELEQAARRAAAGDLEARARPSPLADRELEALIRVFNDMLERVAVYRRRMRAVTARALDTLEEERRRVAQELYDDTAQALAELVIRLRLARCNCNGAERDQALEEVRAGLTAAIERVRRYAAELRPPSLDLLGLVPALEGYARTLEARAGIRVNVRADPVAGLLVRDAELALYRIVQEALENVARHSGARMAVVDIRRRPDGISAVIQDPGHGFSPEQAERDGALGLLGMQERAHWVGGRVRIQSQRGTGTRVEVEMPLRSREATACRT
ncbi:MAG: HAMP domain-containing protein [Gemmatimonadetes bacterium]|nr:HAMP domain-containing protein [Gemmatimonadota bacterium]